MLFYTLQWYFLPHALMLLVSLYSLVQIIQDVQITLSILDFDSVLLIKRYVNLTYESTIEQVNKMNAWEGSNRLSLMFIRMININNIKASLSSTTSAQEYLKAIKDTLMKKLTMTEYNDTRDIQNYILNMSDKTVKLKALGMIVNESFFI